MKSSLLSRGYIFGILISASLSFAVNATENKSAGQKALEALRADTTECTGNGKANVNESANLNESTTLKISKDETGKEKVSQNTTASQRRNINNECK